jgi:hypothetical protein
MDAGGGSGERVEWVVVMVKFEELSSCNEARALAKTARFCEHVTNTGSSRARQTIVTA